MPVPRVRFTARRLTAAVAAGLAFFLILNIPWRQTIHSIEIPGLAGHRVDFFVYRSVLRRDGLVYVRFDGSETKAPFLGPATTAEEVRRGTSVDYDGQTLTIRGPGGRSLSVAGYTP
jgi:hypothetical protein